MSNNYKILLVDDEDEIRGRISSLIERDSGFLVVGKAGNGHDAYELVEELRPDVVLTDIKMPFIDGIELARMLKRDFPTVKVAFISGYDEFRYAQEAINLNVISYLMKPITIDDITHFLGDLKRRLDEEYSRKYNVDIAMKHYQESLPLMIDHAISNILISEESKIEDISHLEQLGFDIEKGKFIACWVEVESSEDHDELITLEKLLVLIKELISSSFANYKVAHSLLVQNGIFIFVRQENEPIITTIDSFIYELLQSSELYMKIRIRVGVSSVFYDLLKISNAFKESKQAIQYGKFLNTGRIVYITDVENKELKRIILSPETFKEIENIAKFGTTDELHNILEAQKKMISAQKNYNLSHDFYVISLANIILNFSQSISSNTDDLFDHSMLEKLQSFATIDELFEWTEQTILELRKRYIENSISWIDEILNKAILFVEEHYKDPLLSLNMVCDHLNISISYLSMLLKREKNITFNKFVIQVRMEKAKELLRTTNHKIIDISLLCGYNEVYYFSHSFKKYTGESPKQFREAFHV